MGRRVEEKKRDIEERKRKEIVEWNKKIYKASEEKNNKQIA